MIQLREDCLLVEQPGGGYVPWSANQLTLEFIGGAANLMDDEVLRHVAAGVLHYFREELGRTMVTVGEFAQAIARVLNGLGFSAEVTEVKLGDPVRIADLQQLAHGSGKLGELEFFLRLRATLREQLAGAPRTVEFRGLRSCVKQLVGRKNWCPACDRMEAWIIDSLRRWFELEPASARTALVVR